VIFVAFVNPVKVVDVTPSFVSTNEPVLFAFVRVVLSSLTMCI